MARAECPASVVVSLRRVAVVLIAAAAAVWIFSSAVALV